MILQTSLSSDQSSLETASYEYIVLFLLETLTVEENQSFLDMICPSFKAAFTPGPQITINKSVISFKGRVSFRQCLKGKPNPWGMKVFVISNSKPSYLNQSIMARIRESPPSHSQGSDDPCAWNLSTTKAMTFT